MSKKIILFWFVGLLPGTFCRGGNPVQPSADKTEYTQGVFFVNEDWYGHQNGTVNFLSDAGEWTYQVFQKSNPGKELGCTSQFGAIYGDKFYLVSKQERDPGAKVTGSRFAVCDAKTMKCLKEFRTIATNEKGESIADGRSFLGVNEKKGYIGTSNGIWIYDMERMEIGHQIEGTGNPNSSGYGQLYYAQIGTMVRVGESVFAVHQQDGIKVIDAETDVLIKTIAAPTYLEEGKVQFRGFGSLVLSKDGSLWASLAVNTLGDGSSYPYLMKINPYTLDTELIPIPTGDGIQQIPNSWYAWNADSFCASIRENKLYWSGTDDDSWFKGKRIFCYDIDRNAFSLVIDFQQIPGEWMVYGAGFRLHPVTDEIYCSLYHAFLEPTYEVMRLSNRGKLLQEYPMITNYWFPAMPVFPDLYAPEISDELTDLILDKETRIYMGDKVDDKDHVSAAIVKSVVAVSNKEVLSAFVRNDSLILLPQGSQVGFSDVTLQFNSNGRIATKEIRVTVSEPSGTPDVRQPLMRVYPNPTSSFITVEAEAGTPITLFNLYGQCMCRIVASAAVTTIYIEDWADGTYFLKTGDQVVKVLKQ